MGCRPAAGCEREFAPEEIDGLSDVADPSRVLWVVTEGGQDGAGERAGEDADLELDGRTV
jgi:hypothetical protein